METNTYEIHIENDLGFKRDYRVVAETEDEATVIAKDMYRQDLAMVHKKITVKEVEDYGG